LFILTRHMAVVNHQQNLGTLMQIVQNISLLPLTIWLHPCKIDSVWCTLAQY